MATRKEPSIDLVVAYLRVSTEEQVTSGAGLAAQRAIITGEAARRGWTIGAWCEDAGLSAKTLKRPGLADALALVESVRSATLVVAKLDRLSRSLVDFARLMERARGKGWNLVALDLGIDLSTPAGEFLASVMASAAQWERRIIGQRTREALGAKRAAGVRLGRPATLPGDVLRRIVGERAGGATLQAIADGLNSEAVPTAQGGARWHPATVRAALCSQDAAAIGAQVIA